MTPAMETATTLQASRETAALRCQRIPLTDVSSTLTREWEQFLERNRSSSLVHNPDWLREHFGEEKGTVFVYFLYHGDLLQGLAPFVFKNWPVKCQIGEITVANLPLRRLCVLGGAVLLPDDQNAYELLFRELLLTEDFDALYLEDTPVDSFLWKFSQSSPSMTNSFWHYVPDAPAPRILLRLEGDFEDYITKFSSKHRKNLKRTVRLFEEQAPGEIELVRIKRPDEVSSFIEQAVEISRKTYQWKLLGLGLRSPEAINQYLTFMAHQGWLRAYLLKCKGSACAFVVGFQYRSHYYLNDMGYDPAWRDFSVGKILQLMLIEDLFKFDRPAVYDLGEYGAHKEEFGTESHLQGKLFLFRRRIYPGIVRAGHRAGAASTTAASALLDRFGWKKPLKKIVRMWSSRL